MDRAPAAALSRREAILVVATGCAGAGIGRETIVPVTSSGSATFAGMAVATGSRTVSARPNVKLIAPTATTTAPAAAKTIILRIALFPQNAEAGP